MQPGKWRQASVVRGLALGVPFIAIALGQSEVLVATGQQIARWAAGSTDAAQAQDRRLAPLGQILPEYGVIGYYDPDQSARGAGPIQAFYLAQYSLAPRVLLLSSEPEYVVYSSHLGRPLDPAALPEGLQVFARVQPDLAVLIRLR